MPRGHATTMHWTPLDRGRARTVLGCTARVLADSNRTLDIITVEEITAQAQLRHLVDSGVFGTTEGRALLADRPHLADVELELLRGLPEGSLGREWVRFLDDHGLDPGLTKQPTPYTDDERCAYLMHRIRESHDLWHVLLGVGTRGHEEVLVHAFSLAQTGLPSSIAIVVLGALKHMVLERRWSVLRRDVRRAHRRGTRAAPLLAVYWEKHLERPLADVRAQYGIEPLVEPVK
jgi:ubiquinone biosynthesis protein COQ4